MAPEISINDQDVLLAIDTQADFMPGGALAEGGNEIVPLVNRVARRFDHVVITQDWHPATHASFAASHEGAKPFDTKRLHYGDQTLWPEHCVQGTPGVAPSRTPLVAVIYARMRAQRTETIRPDAVVRIQAATKILSFLDRRPRLGDAGWRTSKSRRSWTAPLRSS